MGTKMNIKDRNLYELICYAIFIVLIFIPGLYIKQLWKYDDTYIYHGGSTHTGDYSSSLFSILISGNAVWTIVGLLLIMIAITGLVLVILQYKSVDEKQNSKTVIIINIIYTVCFVFGSSIIFLVDNDSIYFNTEVCPGVFFWIQLIILVILSVYSYKTYIQFEKLVFNNTNDNELSSSLARIDSDADLLLKYKELLDTGIITEDDYNRKKKQLLKLE